LATRLAFNPHPRRRLPLGRSPYNFPGMSMDDHGTKRRKNIAENFSRLSRAHERYRRQTTDDRQTDGRQQISNVNVSSRSLKNWLWRTVKLPVANTWQLIGVRLCRSAENNWINATTHVFRTVASLLIGRLAVNGTLTWIQTVCIFTALHEMQTRSSDGNSVCPSVRLSVCLSVTRLIPDKMEERSVQSFIPDERTIILLFWEKRMVGGGGRPLLREILGQPTPVGTKSPIFN